VLIFLFTERTRGGGFSQTHKAATGDFVALYPSFLDLKCIPFGSVLTKYIDDSALADQDSGKATSCPLADLRPAATARLCPNREL